MGRVRKKVRALAPQDLADQAPTVSGSTNDFPDANALSRQGQNGGVGLLATLESFVLKLLRQAPSSIPTTVGGANRDGPRRRTSLGSVSLLTAKRNRGDNVDAGQPPGAMARLQATSSRRDVRRA